MNTLQIRTISIVFMSAMLSMITTNLLAASHENLQLATVASCFADLNGATIPTTVSIDHYLSQTHSKAELDHKIAELQAMKANLGQRNNVLLSNGPQYRFGEHAQTNRTLLWQQLNPLMTLLELNIAIVSNARDKTPAAPVIQQPVYTPPQQNSHPQAAPPAQQPTQPRPHQQQPVPPLQRNNPVQNQSTQTRSPVTENAHFNHAGPPIEGQSFLSRVWDSCKRESKSMGIDPNHLAIATVSILAIVAVLTIITKVSERQRAYEAQLAESDQNDNEQAEPPISLHDESNEDDEVNIFDF